MEGMRKTYGDEFAPGYRSDAQLGTQKNSITNLLLNFEESVTATCFFELLSR